MIRIPLSQGYFATVDDEDADLCAFSWSVHIVTKTGVPDYAKGGVGEKGKLVRVKMHREIAKRIGIDIEKYAVDHINCDPLDNRRANLRAATPSQNSCNRRPQSNNTSGFKGVSWCKRECKFRASIRALNKQRSLGYYETPQEAYAAYCKAAASLHGEFARFV